VPSLRKRVLHGSTYQQTDMRELWIYCLSSGRNEVTSIWDEVLAKEDSDTKH
jgi:hypothetical protein